MGASYEQRWQKLNRDREGFRNRIVAAGRRHARVADLQARNIDATTEQLRIEMAMARRRKAS